MHLHVKCQDKTPLNNEHTLKQYGTVGEGGLMKSVKKSEYG
jgi:hypothetical protein